MNNKASPPYCNQCSIRLQSVFKDISSEELGHISSTKGCTFLKKGDILFSEGDMPTGLYCLHEGKAKIYKTGDEGKHHIVRFAKAGDVMGYRALLSGAPYTATAAALEESVVCRIPKETLLDSLKVDAGLSMSFIAMLSGELGKAEEQIVKLAQKPVRERLAETLLVLKEVYGTENGEDSPLNVTLSREELASVVGTAIETLVRTLTDLKKENLIATEKKKIRILDVQGLIRVGNLQD